MQVFRVTGSHGVAALLHNLANEIERRSLEFEGRSVRLSDSLEATVDLAADKQAAISLIEVRLEHPAPAAWNLTELHQALAHPGD